MGWIQLVRSTDGETPDEYELDPLALFRHVDTPYAFFGIKPELFDAPFREHRRSIRWQAGRSSAQARTRSCPVSHCHCAALPGDSKSRKTAATQESRRRNH
jgi:hypothetical protein